MTTSQVAHNSNKKPKYHFSDSFSTRLEITGLYITTMVTRLEITGLYIRTMVRAILLHQGSQAYPKIIEEILG